MLSRADFLDNQRRAGQISAANQASKRCSKNETLFADYCATQFETLTNVRMFEGWDADVIIPSLKVAILWNGPWHYKQISKRSSLVQIQNRDRLKLDAIRNCGYVPYVIKDMGKHNILFVGEQFGKFIAEWSSSSLPAS